MIGKTIVEYELQQGTCTEQLQLIVERTELNRTKQNVLEYIHKDYFFFFLCTIMFDLIIAQQKKTFCVK